MAMADDCDQAWLKTGSLVVRAARGNCIFRSNFAPIGCCFQAVM